MQRCYYIDSLKFIGLTLIILAHVDPPHFLAQLRIFDVPLMLFASGLAFSGKEINNYWRFVWPRTKRLVVPVYVFLLLYFPIEYLLKRFAFIDSSSSITTMICSFAMLNTKAIHFVWIIRVFLLIMIITPLLLSINKKIKNNCLWWLLICILLLMTESIYLFLCVVHGYKSIYYITYETVADAIAYSIPFLVGARYRYSDATKIYNATFVSLILFLFCYIAFNENSSILTISLYKYPPRMYYISYGVMCSLALWAIRSFIENKVVSDIVIFIGQHTIWIYLYHIPLLALCGTLDIKAWYAVYIIVYMSSVFLFYLQYELVTRLEQKYQSSFFKYLKS